MARRRFDQNKNRVDYGELLIEDSAFELEQAVGMTYSLDMEALMGIPLCLGMRGTESADYLHYWRTVFMRFVCLRVHITSIQNYGFYSIAMSTMAEL